MNLRVMLRLSGATLMILALFHVVLWRSLHWDSEMERLSPLSARVFAVHTFFIAFVLFGLGLLSFARPDLLLARGELARLLLGGVVVFWVARLLLQPLVFDRAMRNGWTRSAVVRVGASILWAGYVVIYGAVLLKQLE